MADTEFLGEVEALWLSDGRKMRLLKEISFKDSEERIWTAPEGSVIDGASIPRELWSMIGSPFVGKFRRASVIHDVACVERSQPYELVHHMFLEAMLCDGVKKGKANIMYFAVRDFGPRWDEDGNDLQLEEEWDDNEDGDEF